MAPFAPFLSDELYHCLTGAATGDVEASVHLSDFPEPREGDKDAALEERMELVRQIVSLGRAVRERERLKVRQPLSRVLVDNSHEPLIGGMTELVMDELNVKEVVFLNDSAAYMDYEIKPDFKAAGPVFGKEVKAFAAALAAMPKEETAALAAALSQGAAGGEDGTAVVHVGDSAVKVSSDLVDVRVSAKEGYAVAMEGGIFVIVDTALTDELIMEGLAREFVSKVQQLRKQRGLEMMDRIEIDYEGDDEVAEAVVAWQDYISGETLADRITRKQTGSGGEACDLNGHKAGIDLRKI